MQPTDRTPPSRRHLGRLLHMPLQELAFRGKQETSKLVDRIRVSKTRHDHDLTALNRFIDTCDKHFFAGAFDRRVPEILSRVFSNESQMLLVEADRVFHGTFDLLGYRDLRFGSPIEWAFEPIANRRAPLIHWTRLDPLDAASVGDSKVIWELNRQQWLVHLAQAWRATRYERYADAVVRHVQHWIDANPYGIGINWASSLEVAFRLIAWCWSLALVFDAPAVTPEWFARFENAIDQHARHVERYLSLYFSPNTHVTGEALALFYAGVLFPNLERAEQWRLLGAEILEGEIARQVHSDGVYFEQSTCYQRYTIDIYLHFLILASRAGIGVSTHVDKAVKDMLGVLVALRNPDRSMPKIGDEDGGVLLPLATRDRCDYAPTFSTAAVVFDDPVFAWAAQSLAPESLWLLGSEALMTFETLRKTPPQSSGCELFRQGGIAVMRSGWDEKAHALIFDVGPLGCRFSSGHGHADLLSIQCSAFGTPYIVDPGTCCYTADPLVRDYFRGTGAHSTVVVDAKSQAQPAGPFAWQTKCAARLRAWSSDESYTYADADHNAYAPVVHRRRVIFVKSRYWIVIDDVDGNDTHRIDVRFQFAPMLLTVEGPSVRASRNGRNGLYLRAFSSTSLDLSVTEGWYSSDYGRKEPAPAVVYSGVTELPLRVVTLLYPLENVAEAIRPNLICDADGVLTGLTLPHRGETVFFDGPEPRISGTCAE